MGARPGAGRGGMTTEFSSARSPWVRFSLGWYLQSPPPYTRAHTCPRTCSLWHSPHRGMRLVKVSGSTSVVTPLAKRTTGT